MAKKKSSKKTTRRDRPSQPTPEDTITVVLPEQLAGVDKKLLLEIAKLVFGATGKFDVSNIVFVSQDSLSETIQDEIWDVQIGTSNC
jgi:hypothetical protein